jgi:hypothetical protein
MRNQENGKVGDRRLAVFIGLVGLMGIGQPADSWQDSQEIAAKSEEREGNLLRLSSSSFIFVFHLRPSSSSFIFVFHLRPSSSSFIFVFFADPLKSLPAICLLSPLAPCPDFFFQLSSLSFQRSSPFGLPRPWKFITSGGATGGFARQPH